VLAGVALAAGLLPLGLRSVNSTAPIYGGFSHHWKYPRSSVAAVVHALAGRDDTLATWGWACFLHVECALPQATRDGTTAALIEASSQQAGYRTSYLADLQRHPPAVFVDAVGPGAFVYTDRVHQAHEIFPELAGFIRQNYTLVLEQPDARVYARNGLPTLQRLTQARLRQLALQGRDPEKFLFSLSAGGLDPLQRKRTDKDMIVLLPPGARLEWPLDEGVSGFAFEIGDDPDAGPGGEARFTFELVGPAGTRPLFLHVPDPTHQAGNNSLQAALVPLPVFAPGTVLVLRTDPTSRGLHLAGLKLQRAPAPPSR
jgi:hypothetical protein